MSNKPKVRGVSLSGKTRLTYREAVALLEAANMGYADIEAGEEEDDKSILAPLGNATRKLKIALLNAGGYDDEGNLYDPFREKGGAS